MFGFLLCFVVSVVEWFLAAKRTSAIVRRNKWAAAIAASEVALGFGAGYVVFVQHNWAAAIACVLGAGVGVALARKRG
jgi:hypothetical protein